MKTKTEEPDLITKARAAKIAAEIAVLKKQSGELVERREMEEALAEKETQDALRIWEGLRELPAILAQKKLIKNNSAGAVEEMLRGLILNDTGHAPGNSGE